MYRYFLLMCLAVISINTQAATNTYRPVFIGKLLEGVSGYNGELTVARNLGTSSSAYLKTGISIGKASLGLAGLARLASPTNLAMMAVIEAGGYVYNELTGDVEACEGDGSCENIEPTEDDETFYTGGKCDLPSPVPTYTTSGSFTLQDCVDLYYAYFNDLYDDESWWTHATGYAESYYVDDQMVAFYIYSDTTGTTDGQAAFLYDYEETVTYSCDDGYTLTEVDGEELCYPDTRVLSSTEVGEIIVSDLNDYDIYDDVLSDPDTGYPYLLSEVETATTTVANYDITNNYSDDVDIDYTIEGDTVADSDSDADADDLVSTTTQTEVTFQQSFCEYASTLCDWLNWTQTPYVESDVPDDSEFKTTVDVTTLQQSYTHDFGVATCPEPETASFTMPVTNKTITVELSYEPFCELMGYAYYLVLASAWIGAAFIVSGNRRS